MYEDHYEAVEQAREVRRELRVYQASLLAGGGKPRFCVRSTEGEVLCDTFVEAANVARSYTQRGIKATVGPWTATKN